ncbi:unnamed protein product [Ilex paraguariensis]|uniref:Uncharacterized protein n=1 Tax=Ilex paraguariensis TaxID=185542 RepID=A0ABC8SBD7_9AQUA
MLNCAKPSFCLQELAWLSAVLKWILAKAVHFLCGPSSFAVILHFGIVFLENSHCVVLLSFWVKKESDKMWNLYGINKIQAVGLLMLPVLQAVVVAHGDQYVSQDFNFFAGDWSAIYNTGGCLTDGEISASPVEIEINVLSSSLTLVSSPLRRYR